MPFTNVISATTSLVPNIENPMAQPPFKPCCVCKEEKSSRDECFLFSEKGGEIECVDKIDAYKKCMAEFGFKI